ncbi:lipid II flippase MurJ, partial [Streptomyces clavuligerus]
MVVRDAQDIVPPGQELPPLMLPFEAGDPRGTTGGEGPHGPAGAAVDARGTTAADPSAGPPPGTRGPVPAVAAVVRLWTGGGPAGGARGSAPGSAPRAAGSGDVSGGGGARTAGRMSGSPPGPGGPGAHPYAATGGVRTGRETAPDGPSGAVRADRGGGTADPGAEGRRLGNVLARAAAVTAGLTVAGAVLGLVRDQTIAQIYGASTESDAFLVAWTVPEMAATLLIEDAMALLLVPAFSHAIAHRAAPGAADGRLPGGGGEDPVRRLVSATFPRFLAVLTVATGVLVVFAPEFVHALAPGFRDPGLAADCTRLTALTVLTYGVAGYFSAALRAHGRFLHPAAVYIASNVGIIGTTLLLHSVWGVRGAATGVAVGGLLMVLVQLPSVVRHVALPPLGRRRAA